MPLTKLTCPECSTVLRPSKPVAEGKSVKCPKCGAGFVAGVDLREAVRAKPTNQQPPKGGPAPKPAGDDDDGPGVYAFREDPAPPPPVEKKRPRIDDEDDDDDDEEDDEEEKEKTAKKAKDQMYMLDESVKDPRGPAQEAVVKPSNLLMLTATALIVIQFFSLFIWAFPFIFSEHLLEPKDVRAMDEKDNKSGKAVPTKKEWKDLNNEIDKVTMRVAEDEEQQRRLLWMIPGVCGVIWGGIIVLAAYKMQNMESYPWSWVGGVMMMLGGGFMINGFWWLRDFLMDMDPGQGEMGAYMIMGGAAAWCVFTGVIVMVTLKREKVKIGFYWVPE